MQQLQKCRMNFFEKIFYLFLLLSLLMSFLIIKPASAETSTPTFGVMNTRNNFIDDSINPPLKEKWQLTADTDISFFTGRMVESEGVLVANAAGPAGNLLVGINVETGQILWKYYVKNLNNNPVSIYKGNIFFGDGDGYIYSLNLGDGRLNWKRKDYLSWTLGVSGYIAVEDGKIFAWGTNNIFALNSQNGDLLWKYGTSLASLCKGISYCDGIVFIGLADIPGGKVIALDSVTGKKLWDSSVFISGNKQNYISPVIYDNKVFMSRNNDGIYALNITDGKPVWDEPYPLENTTEPEPMAVSKGILYTKVKLYNNYGIPYYELHAIDAAAKALKWKSALTDFAGIPLIVGDKLFINDSNRMVVYNAQTGQKLESIILSSATRMSSPIAASGKIIIQTDYNKIKAFTGSNRLTPVILIPGITGSWSNDLYKLQDPWRKIDYKQERNKWKMGFGLWSQVGLNLDPMSKLKKELVKQGYLEGQNLFTLPYDWRRSNTLTAEEFLKPLVREAQEKYRETNNLPLTAPVKVDIVAHSMGGLVARYFIQNLGGEKDVDKFIMLGTPNYGSPKAYFMWEGGVMAPFTSSLAGHYVDYKLQWLIDRYADMNIKPYTWRNYYEIRAEERVKAVQRYVPSVRELLPVIKPGLKDGWWYLIDSKNNNKRLIDDMLEKNDFLKQLNKEESKIKLKNLDSYTIRGSGFTRSIIVVDDDYNLTHSRWPDGIPVEYLGISKNDSWFSKDGDGTVLWESTILDVARDLGYIKEEHGMLPNNDEAIEKVLGIIKGYTAIEKISEKKSRNCLTFALNCPADLLVIAPDGKKIGFDENSELINELPEKAEIVGSSGEGQLITVLDPWPGDYKVKVTGRGTGFYNLKVSSYSEFEVREAEKLGISEKDKIMEYNLAVSDNDVNEFKFESLDLLPPKSHCEIEGIKGENDWYLSPVEINISSEDNEGGTGLSSIDYKLGQNDWTKYSEPLKISSEGRQNIRFQAVDYAINKENIREINVKIDMTPPRVFVNKIRNPYIFNQPVFVFCARDEVSGLKKVEAYLNGRRIKRGLPLNIVEAGVNELKIEAWDYAGNKVTETFKLNVPYYTKRMPPLNHKKYNFFFFKIKKPAVFINFSVPDYFGSPFLTLR